MRQVVVTPAKGISETSWVLSLAFLILALCSVLIFTRGKEAAEEEISPWQINAFAELNASEMGVFNALLTAAIEIEQAHEEGGWMEVVELEGMFIPPFARDTAWQKQGKIVWEKNIFNAGDKHIAAYKGTPANDAVRGDFLLVMLHDHQKKQGNAAAGHAPFEIWIHDQAGRKFPQMITDQALIAAGWREIVALTGKDEITKTKGKLE
ncbi:MAG: hypothetical protein CSB24_04205 [Deltaproteobacteria bacterium]|nr:MAG: hypothetical protein CSB24_04205 [Deltaproteobacteria bacterium]